MNQMSGKKNSQVAYSESRQHFKTEGKDFGTALKRNGESMLYKREI